MPAHGSVPALRVRIANDAPVAASGDYVLYWMTAFRRTHWNFSLQRAVDWSKELNRPLLIFEALRCQYPWASDRFHWFVIQGMADNAQRLADRGVAYYPYLEPRPGAGQGLLEALARRACLVVGDDYPCFFLPGMVRLVAPRLPVRFELVDANGLLPLRAADAVFSSAYSFRRFLQKHLRSHLSEMPADDPLRRLRLPRLDSLPPQIAKRWPVADVPSYAARPARLAEFPLDHEVQPGCLQGGSRAAERQLIEFLRDRLGDYETLRNHPDSTATSDLSPYLHFGQISVHQVFTETMRREGWTVDRLSDRANGRREGWWGASSSAEAYLDQLVTWRELGFNLCWQRRDYDRYESLPAWAQQTLARHAHDPRQPVYDLEEFRCAQTHDALWNAAQRQLLQEGRLHNYLRMLWGKKILQWSQSPQAALRIMIELNNRYALDGRDPNSYSGIFWVLGRYDRPWGPERKIFGTVRYMASENTARKVRLKQYLAKYGPAQQG